MRSLRASFLIALTLLASLPICCCAFDSAGDKEVVPSCCHSEQPVDEKLPCHCDEHGDTVMEAKSFVEIIPVPVLKLADSASFNGTFHSSFQLEFNPIAGKRDNSHCLPSSPLPAPTALEHCTVLAVFLV